MNTTSSWNFYSNADKCCYRLDKYDLFRHWSKTNYEEVTVSTSFAMTLFPLKKKSKMSLESFGLKTSFPLSNEM